MICGRIECEIQNWTNSLVVELLPLSVNRFLDRVCKWGDIGPQGDPAKVFEPDGSERRSDTLHIWPHRQKVQFFEFCGRGKVKRSRPNHVCVYKGL